MFAQAQAAAVAAAAQAQFFANMTAVSQPPPPGSITVTSVAPPHPPGTSSLAFAPPAPPVLSGTQVLGPQFLVQQHQPPPPMPQMHTDRDRDIAQMLEQSRYYEFKTPRPRSTNYF